MSDSGNLVQLQQSLLDSAANEGGVRPLVKAIQEAVQQLRPKAPDCKASGMIDHRRMTRFLYPDKLNPDEALRVAFTIEELRWMDDYLISVNQPNLSSQPLFKREAATNLCRSLSFNSGKFIFFLTTRAKREGSHLISLRDVQTMSEVMSIKSFERMRNIVESTQVEDQLTEETIFAYGDDGDDHQTNNNIYLSVASPMLSHVSTLFLKKMIGDDNQSVPFHFTLRNNDPLYSELRNPFVKYSDNLREGVSRKLSFGDREFECEIDRVGYGVLACQRFERGIMMVISGSHGFSTKGIAGLLRRGDIKGELPPYSPKAKIVSLAITKTIVEDDVPTTNVEMQPALRRYHNAVWEVFRDGQWVAPKV